MGEGHGGLGANLRHFETQKYLHQLPLQNQIASRRKTSLKKKKSIKTQKLGHQKVGATAFPPIPPESPPLNPEAQAMHLTENQRQKALLKLFDEKLAETRRQMLEEINMSNSLVDKTNPAGTFGPPTSHQNPQNAKKKKVKAHETGLKKAQDAKNSALTGKKGV